MRLLLDEMYPRRLAEQLRDAGHDVVGVVEFPELIGSADADVARFGRKQRRVVVTENVADYALLDPDEHAGLLLVNGRRWPRTASRLPRLAAALGAWLAARAEPRASDDVDVVQWL